MFIEDLIQHLYLLNSHLYTFDRNIVNSLYLQYLSSTNYTEKQGKLAIYLLKKYKTALSTHLNQDVSTFLDNPKFKKQFRVINTEKLINIIDHPTFVRAIKVTFPYDEALISKFKSERNQLSNVIWDNDSKSWFFSLHVRNISFLNSLLSEFGFTADQEFHEYREQIENINKNIENYIPLITKVDDCYVLKNNHPTADPNLGKELIPSLFTARKMGFFIWDDIVDKELTENSTDIVVKNFLKSSGSKEFVLDLSEHSICSLEHVVKNLLPCLIVIPGGSELPILDKTVDFIKKIGFSNLDISVMFRLNNDSEQNKEFNNFVKQEKLNNPISEQTKFVFVSNNIPKPLLESRLNFNTVLNYNFCSPHYKLRDFIQDHHNVISIVELSTQRRYQFEYVV